MNVMLDLETMGNGNKAAVIAIGAARFDQHGVHETFYSTIDLVDAAKYGDLDASTVKWWLQQEADARRELYLASGKLEQVLIAFTDYIASTRNLEGVWGFGATFDNVILRNAYNAVGLNCPWHFRQDRCFRTLAAVNTDVDWEPRVGTHHNARDDAVTQAKTAVKMLYPTINIQL